MHRSRVEARRESVCEKSSGYDNSRRAELRGLLDNRTLEAVNITEIKKEERIF